MSIMGQTEGSPPCKCAHDKTSHAYREPAEHGARVWMYCLVCKCEKYAPKRTYQHSNEKVQVRLPAARQEWWEDYAHREGLTLGRLVGRILEEHRREVLKEERHL